MIDGLLTTAFTGFGAPTTWAELLGFATGVVTVWLLVRQHILNWPVGILNVVLLMVVFWSAGLYADAGLQVVYIVLGLYGWWAWRYGGHRHTRLTVRATTVVIYIPLYAYKELWLTATLYLVFLTLCVLGLRAWRAALPAPAAVPA